MISVVIPALNAENNLPSCFDSLIAGAVRGLVREVIVADGGSSDATLSIADAAGARIVQAGKSRAAQLIAGAETARSDWLLFLHPQTALESGWENEAESFIAKASNERPRAAAFRFALDDFSGPARRSEAGAALRCWFLALSYGEQGLLIPKRLYKKLGGYRPLAAAEDADLVRRIGRRRLVMLRSRAINMAREGDPIIHVRTFLHALRIPSRVVARI
jgi:glycosyltransferase involved in cell wall biosynthesis